MMERAPQPVREMLALLRALRRRTAVPAGK